jgi:hypothetical protein
MLENDEPIVNKFADWFILFHDWFKPFSAAMRYISLVYAMWWRLRKNRLAIQK